ncbi:hypothetical protein C8J57DRAFT_1526817 [Mycena rebaudengoi]|nr:hypothetical protein C8J57DRAFT_1526817 [Mycena rebaudengoi]
MDSAISSSLPLDLEREIFEIAANRYPESIPTLLVAQRVLQWIQPLLYRTLVFRSLLPRDPAAFCPEPAKLAEYVQNLIIWGTRHNGNFAPRILSYCSGIQKLALFGPNPTMLPALEKMQLRQLTILHLQGLFGVAVIDPTHLLFCALTHLRLHD